MKSCKTIGCHATLDTHTETDFCNRCLGRPSANDETIPTKTVNQASSGSDNNYWLAKITHPKRLDPYEAECEDLIEHFQMSFQEGEAFKALWRNGQMRIGNGKPGDSHLRNAQKVRHFGTRMEVLEKRALE